MGTPVVVRSLIARGVALLGFGAIVGCILEPNPGFSAGESMGASSTSGASVGNSMSGTEGSGSAASDTASDSAGTGGDEVVEQGCDEPDCPEIHVGFGPLDCEHTEGGAKVLECDHSGQGAITTALAEAALLGGARVYLHDEGGLPATFEGGLDVPGHTSILAYGDTPHHNLRVRWNSPNGLPNVLRLVGDDIHLRGFTVITERNGGSGISFSGVGDVEGPLTGGHLIENLELIGMTPEDVGSNSTVAVLQPVGRDVVVRNCRVWGFHENAIDLRGAPGFRFYNNTVAYYQQLGDTFFDATDATDIQISNNVFLALTDDVGALVGASSLTEDLRVAGNVIEGAGAIVIGAQPGAPSIVVENNPLGEAPLQAPHFPRFHADAAVEIDLTAPAAGTSLDGVELASVTSPLPGAYQTRSTLSGPRRMVTTVGGGSCGGGPCDVNPAEENATQIAVWSTWPGGTVELYPGTHSGAVISWPMNLRGTAWDEVTVERNPQGFLNAFRFFSRHPSVIRVTEHLRAAVEVSELTIAVGPDETGLTVEGTDASAPPSPNVVQRVRVIDRGDTDGDLAEVGFWLGHHVVLHDALVLGGFQICVRHGVRDGTYDETPPSTNWVYNLTCRQTKTVTDQPLSGFEVASVSGSQWFNIALELAEAGPLFRAQRRAWSDRPELDSGPVALDAPSSFTATAWVLRGRSDDYDGFSDAQGTFVQTDVDDLSPNDPFFISPTDSHLAPGAAGIDAGVDPVSIDASLLPGTDLDGIPRSGAVIDRGAYEQGS